MASSSSSAFRRLLGERENEGRGDGPARKGKGSHDQLIVLPHIDNVKLTKTSSSTSPTASVTILPRTTSSTILNPISGSSFPIRKVFLFLPELFRSPGFDCSVGYNPDIGVHLNDKIPFYQPE